MRPVTEIPIAADPPKTAAQVHEASLFDDIPRGIWIAFLSAWAVLFGLFILFFTTTGSAMLAVLTASFFALMTLGLPAALGAVPKTSSHQAPRIIRTRNGPLSTRAAATQILLIPVGTVIGLIAFIALAM